MVTPPGDGLAALEADVVACRACPRLVAWREEVARTKRHAYRDETYWGRPVPGFGDPGARVLVVGLAPAAHGANRTGRVFTGDGVGGSCDFLMTAMHAHGFANQPTSHHAADGLALTGAFIAAVCRCAPPDNKPLPAEIANCRHHLDAERSALPQVSVIVALGRIAADACWRMLPEGVRAATRRPPFSHGQVIDPAVPGVPVIVESYHPSRQNTNTGRLTPPMMSQVFAAARQLVERPPSPPRPSRRG